MPRIEIEQSCADQPGGRAAVNRGLEVGIAAVLLLLLVLLKFPVLTMPFHWDEMGAYVTPARNLAEGGLKHILTGFRPGPSFFGHPPLLYTTLALTYAVFGFSIIVSHAYVLFWSFLGIFYTYRLGGCLFGRSAGICAGLFLLFTPLYFAQSGMVLGEIPITALGVMAVYYALQTRLMVCVLCGIAAVLLKETAVAIPAAVAVYAVICQTDRYGSRWKLLWFALPLFVLAGFYLWQKAVTGHWLPNPYFNTHPMASLDLNRIVNKAVWVASFTAVRQYRVLWLLLILLSFAITGKHAWRREYALFALIGMFFVGAFSLIYFDMRYVLAALPYLAVMAAGAMTSMIRKRSAQAVVCLFVLVMSAGVWREHESGYCNYDYDMQYTDMVAIHRQAAQFLEQNHPDARIGASWPVNSLLSKPWQGYVTKPLRIVQANDECDFVLRPDKVQLEPDNLILVRRFEENHKWLNLYQCSPSDSGTSAGQ